LISPQPVNSTSWSEMNPYFANSGPPDHVKLIIVAAMKASPIRMPEMNHQLTPTLEATADSINKLCENDSMIAIIKTSFTVKSNEIIAAIPAYKFNAFPKTNGTAASPERPINFITGLTFSIIQGNIGVYWRMVTINVIGKITFPNIQTVFKPCCRPRYAVPDNPLPPPLFYVYFFFFSFTFFPL